MGKIPKKSRFFWVASLRPPEKYFVTKDKCILNVKHMTGGGLEGVGGAKGLKYFFKKFLLNTIFFLSVSVSNEILGF